MTEKAYKTMKRAGAWNIVIGVVVICIGIAAGIMSIVSGGRLLKAKSDILF